ncbi:hypothetical protein CR513_55967, partial [Mucuna pruriens]
MCFVVNSPLANLPTDFEKMLEGFKDIFSKEIPHELSPIRGTEHQIDFIPRASMTSTNAFALVPRDPIPCANVPRKTLMSSLYVNLETYTFCTNKVIFLGYVVGSQGVKIKCIECKGHPKLANTQFPIGTPSFSFTFGESFREFEIFERMATTYRISLQYVTNTITSHSFFELVYEFNPLTPLDLLPMPNISCMLNCDGISKAQFVKDFHAKAHSHTEKKVEQYANKANKRFPNLRKSKLLPKRGDGPFKVLSKVNDNAYILDMPQTYDGSHTFHVTDLSSYNIGESDVIFMNLKEKPQARIEDKKKMDTKAL